MRALLLPLSAAFARPATAPFRRAAFGLGQQGGAVFLGQSLAPRRGLFPASACLSSSSSSSSSPIPPVLVSKSRATTSTNAAVFKIQQQVFGYVKGNGQRNGRRFLKKALMNHRVSNYYSTDLIGKMRFRDLNRAKDPKAYVERTLAGFSPSGELGKERFGPFQQGTREFRRAHLRMKASRLTSPRLMERSALPKLKDDHRRALRIFRSRMRGKNAPKKGAGKRASRKKK